MRWGWTLVVFLAPLLAPISARAQFVGLCPPHTVYAGPQSGTALDVPKCRALVSADLPTVTPPVIPPGCISVVNPPSGYTAADPSGVTDATAAITSLLTSFTAPSTPCLYFPTGTYLFNNQLSYTYPVNNPIWKVVLRGDGSDETIFRFPSTNGLTLTESGSNQSFLIQGISFITDGTTANGLTVTIPTTKDTFFAYSAKSDLIDVVFRGNESYLTGGVPLGTKYWAKDVILTNVSNVNFYSVNILGANPSAPTSPVGIGVVLGTTAPGTDFGVVFNFTNCIFGLLQYGILIDGGIQGVTVLQSNFTGVSYGIAVPAGQTGTAELVVMASQFNAYISGVEIDSATSASMIMSNLFIIPSGAVGFRLATPYQTTISGNTFSSGVTGQGYGINITGDDAGSMSSIFSNEFNNLLIGINLNAHAGFLVGTNQFGTGPNANVTNINAPGTSQVATTCSAGISATTGTSYNGVVTHC